MANGKRRMVVGIHNQLMELIGRLQPSFPLIWQRGKAISYTDILIGSAAILANALLLHADRHFDLMAEDTDLRVRSLVSVVR